MKELKTSKYLKKVSQYNLPGDDNLPHGTTQRMVDEQFADGADDIAGETDVELIVNGNEFNKWYKDMVLPSGDNFITFFVKYLYNPNSDDISIKAETVYDDKGKDLTAYQFETFSQEELEQEVRDILRQRQ